MRLSEGRVLAATCMWNVSWRDRPAREGKSGVRRAARRSWISALGFVRESSSHSFGAGSSDSRGAAGGGGGGGDMRASKAGDLSTWLRILGLGSGSSSSYGAGSSMESIEEGDGESGLERRYGGFGSGGGSTSGVWRGGGLRNGNGINGATNGFGGGAAPYAATTRLRTKKL